MTHIHIPSAKKPRPSVIFFFEIWLVIALECIYIFVMGYSLGSRMVPRETPRSTNQPLFLSTWINSLGEWLVHKAACLLHGSRFPASSKLLGAFTTKTWVIRYRYV
jgi:hypothetical protein